MAKRPSSGRIGIPKTISLCSSEELQVLNNAATKVRGFLPEANTSEIFRLGLQLIALATPDQLRKASAMIDRRSPGRPTRRNLSAEVETSLLHSWENDDHQRNRLIWLEEFQRLQSENTPETKERRRELCSLLGMLDR
jgi:hypothetical protein